MSALTDKIASAIASVAPQVEDQVVDTMVQRQLKKRADALVQVMDKVDQMKKDLSKVRPDQVAYDKEGKEVDATFSKAKITEKQKLEKAIGKFEGAINKALEKNDYGDLYNLASGKAPAEDKPGDTEEAD